MELKKKLLILEKENFNKKAISLLKKKFKVNGSNININNAECIFIRLKNKIDKKFLQNAKKLKYVISPTTGLNHIDIKELNKRNIKLISLKYEKKFLKEINSTPELTWGLALSLTKKINSSIEDVYKGHWNRDKFKGYDLKDKTCGIVGYGRVGKVINKYARAFGMKVIVYDPLLKNKNFKNKSTLNNIFKKSFLIFITASSNNENSSFINENLFKLTSKCFFINTARGELINYKHLLKYVNGKNLIGAAVDVLPDEQNRKEFLKFINNVKKIQNFKENFLITPHIGGATLTSMQKTEYYLSKKLLECLN